MIWQRFGFTDKWVSSLFCRCLTQCVLRSRTPMHIVQLCPHIMGYSSELLNESHTFLTIQSKVIFAADHHRKTRLNYNQFCLNVLRCTRYLITIPCPIITSQSGATAPTMIYRCFLTCRCMVNGAAPISGSLHEVNWVMLDVIWVWKVSQIGITKSIWTARFFASQYVAVIKILLRRRSAIQIVEIDCAYQLLVAVVFIISCIIPPHMS